VLGKFVHLRINYRSSPFSRTRLVSFELILAASTFASQHEKALLPFRRVGAGAEDVDFCFR